LRQLAEKEGPANLVGAKLKMQDGSTNAMAGGVPKTWGEKLGNIPTSGVLEVAYECAPEKRDIKARRDLAEKFDYWSPADDGQLDVTWWTFIAHVPQDVVLFAESLSGPSSGPLAAFEARSGDDAGALKFAAFEEAFGDKHGGLSFKDIFKFLDAGGEGSVGAKQIGALEDVWQESKQCIRDFVDFVTRSFGGAMEEAWCAVATEGADEIKGSAWPAVLQRLGFFGAPMPAFRWAAGAGGTSITREDFCRLGQFRSESAHTAEVAE